MLAEIDRRKEDLGGRELRSVFFGGGTPSLWEPEQLGRVLAGVTAAAGQVAGDLEVTVECNPTSLDEAQARALCAVGVNRLSVGVQGLDPERLRFLGRLHDPEGGLAALEAARRAGVPRVSGDLIYGVALGAPPGQDVREQPAERAADEARTVARTGVGHVSVYSLTIEAGTAFGDLARRGRLPLASEEAQAEAFVAIEAALLAEGLAHYEISNYARPGEEARHNLGYWRGLDYVGLGCAAFGTITAPGARDAVRYRNLPAPEQYMAAATDGGPLVERVERLDAETRLRERIMLGLRLREGVDLEAAAASLGVPAWSAARHRAAERLERAGRLEVAGGRLTIPRGAWLFADGIAAALF